MASAFALRAGVLKVHLPLSSPVFFCQSEKKEPGSRWVLARTSAAPRLNCCLDSRQFQFSFKTRAVGTDFARNEANGTLAYCRD